MPHTRSAKCECIIGYFTCRYCLSSRKPYFFTLSDGSAIVEVPFQRQPKPPSNEEEA